eukprot:593182_1
MANQLIAAAMFEMNSNRICDGKAKQEAVQQVTKAVNNLPKEGDEYIVIDTASAQYQQHPAFETMKICPLVSGEQGMRCVMKLQKGHIEKPHYHTARTEVFVLEGAFKMTNPITKKESILTKGSYYCNPAKCPHTVECLEDGSFFVVMAGKPDFNPLSQ